MIVSYEIFWNLLFKWYSYFGISILKFDDLSLLGGGMETKSNKDYTNKANKAMNNQPQTEIFE